VVEHGEANPVKTDEAFLRAHPQVAVPRLNNGLGGVLGQSPVGLPGLVAELGDRTGRTLCEKICSGKEKRQPEQSGTLPLHKLSRIAFKTRNDKADS